MTAKDSSPIPDYAARLSLRGRNLIVLGAGQGMGRQSAHAFAQCGAKVMCVDVDAELAHEIAAEVGGFPFVGDITREAEVARLVAEAVAGFGGPIHGFVDIVGIAQWTELIDMEEAAWDAQFDICLRHAYLVSKHVGRHMIEAGTQGSMVFIASVHGLTASVRHAAYGAAKAGLISLVRSLAHELGRHGIRVNAIAPGSILTPPHRRHARRQAPPGGRPPVAPEPPRAAGRHRLGGPVPRQRFVILHQRPHPGGGRRRRGGGPLQRRDLGAHHDRQTG